MARSGKKPRQARLAGRLVLEWHDHISIFGVIGPGAYCAGLSREFLVGEPTHDPRMLHAYQRTWPQIQGTKR